MIQTKKASQEIYITWLKLTTAYDCTITTKLEFYIFLCGTFTGLANENLMILARHKQVSDLTSLT
jgi:hypothetical protein